MNGGNVATMHECAENFEQLLMDEDAVFAAVWEAQCVVAGAVEAVEEQEVDLIVDWLEKMMIAEM